MRLPSGCSFTALVLGSLLCGSVWAQPGVAEGLGFAAGTSGKNQAMGSVSTAGGQAAVPNFTSQAPEASFFSNGRGNLAVPGQSKVVNCQSASASSGYFGQDCNALNFLRGRPGGWAVNGQSPEVQTVVGSARDPIVNPSAYSGPATGSSCRMVTRNVGATYERAICSANMSTSFTSCSSQLDVAIVKDYSCPAGSLSAPVDSSVAGVPGKVCRSQVITPKLRCETGTTGPRDANLTQDEFGRPISLGPPLMVCDTWGYMGDGYAVISSSPALAYDDIQVIEVPATVSDRQADGWLGSCQALEARASASNKPFADCQLLASACTGGAQTRIIDGVAVTRPCWDKAEHYACQGTALVGSCPAIAGKTCTLTEKVCRARDPAGACLAEDDIYSCLSQPAQTVTTQVCGDPAACETNPSACFDTSATPDADFAKAAAIMESSRQGGVYGGQFELFGGSSASCSIKLLSGVAVKSCCASQAGGSAFTNSATLSNLGTQVAMTITTEAGKESLRAGSRYVYDALYSSSNPEWMKSGFEAMKDWGGSLGDGVFNPSFSFYGFTFDLSLSNGFEFTGFDPTSFAIAVGIQLMQQWLSCNQQEQMTMIKKGANLCVHVSTACSSRLFGFGMCLEDTQYHCCFNSVLAKVINRQGGAQLGRPANQCGGFTEAEFQRIDFSKIDFSEFIASIGSPAGDGSALAASQTAVNASRLTNNYFTSGAQR